MLHWKCQLPWSINKKVRFSEFTAIKKPLWLPESKGWGRRREVDEVNMGGCIRGFLYDVAILAIRFKGSVSRKDSFSEAHFTVEQICLRALG